MVKLESKGGIGIFGGTFNPIHLGHLIIAEKVRESLNLEKIIFVPAHYPPHKKAPEIGVEHRYRMVELAISGNSYFVASKIELERKGLSYTVDTVNALKKIYLPEKDFYFILGLDAYLETGSWKEIEKLKKLIRFVVVKRSVIPGGTRNLSFKEVTFLNLEPIAISSSEIRSRIKKGKSVQGLLPDKVMDYIQRRHLYQ